MYLSTIVTFAYFLNSFTPLFRTYSGRWRTPGRIATTAPNGDHHRQVWITPGRKTIPRGFKTQPRTREASVRIIVNNPNYSKLGQGAERNLDKGRYQRGRRNGQRPGGWKVVESGAGPNTHISNERIKDIVKKEI